MKVLIKALNEKYICVRIDDRICFNNCIKIDNNLESISFSVEKIGYVKIDKSKWFYDKIKILETYGLKHNDIFIIKYLLRKQEYINLGNASLELINDMTRNNINYQYKTEIISRNNDFSYIYIDNVRIDK